MLANTYTRTADAMTNVVKLPGEATDAAAAERAAETRLLEQVRDGSDRAAFEKLFAIFTPRLLAWMRAQGTEIAAAESVVQEVIGMAELQDGVEGVVEGVVEGDGGLVAQEVGQSLGRVVGLHADPDEQVAIAGVGESGGVGDRLTGAQGLCV